MKTFTSRMNMKFGEAENAYVMTRVNMGFSAFDTLCLICAEKNIDTKMIDDSDFNSASIVLEDFVKSANEITGYTVSVWFGAVGPYSRHDDSF